MTTPSPAYETLPLYLKRQAVVVNLSADDVVEMLRDRYGDTRRYAFMTEVPERTGNLLGASIIDVAVLCLYKSDGYRLLAFEIKTSRKDWAAEMARPKKNESWRRAADEFSYVAPAGAVNLPVPANAGWIEVVPGTGRGRDRLRMRRTAPRRDDGVRPRPAWPLVASLVRAAIKAEGKP